MSFLQIRAATASDVMPIADLHVEAWRAAYRGLMPEALLAKLDVMQRAEQWTKHLVEPKCDLLVALEGTRVVGFCTLVPTRDPDAAPEDGEISAIYVHPQAWRRRIGTALLQAAVDRANLRGFHRLSLWVLDGNQPARSFYAARGFRSDGRTKTEQLTSFTLREVRYVREL